MRYDDPQLIDKLAAEYVLGTLRGSARRRFEALMRYRRDMQARVTFWQEQLTDLSHGLEPVEPPASVWRGITTRINGGQKGGATKLNFWRSMTGLTAAMASAMLLLIVLPQVSVETASPEVAANHVGLVGDSAKPLWVISADLQSGQLTARAVNATATELDKTFELWMLPNDGAPQSIGLIPVNGGSVTHVLPAGLMALLKESKGLAISVEPLGGSPTGAPTGPIIETLKVWEL